MIGALIRERRLRAGVTQTDLARRTGLSQNYISKLESGSIDLPQRATLEVLGGALGIALAEFYRAAGVLDLPAPADAPDGPPSPDDPVGVLMEYLRNDPAVMRDLAQAQAELSAEDFEEVLRDVAEAHKSNLVMGLRVARRANRHAGGRVP